MDGTPLILQLTSNFYVEQICPSECVVSVVRIVNKNFDPAQLSIRIFRRAGRRLNGLVPPYSPLNQITQVIPNTLYKRKRIYRHDESDRQLVQIYCHSFGQPPRMTAVRRGLRTCGNSARRFNPPNDVFLDRTSRDEGFAVCCTIHVQQIVCSDSVPLQITTHALKRHQSVNQLSLCWIAR